MSDDKRLSTTQLAKLRGIAQEQMFGQLTTLGLIEKQDDKWQLTDAGAAAGGVYLTGKYGQYVAWPEGFQLPTVATKPEAAKLLTSHSAGATFRAPRQQNELHPIRTRLDQKRLERLAGH
ncbi:hypothetical protein [Methylomonas methanica]|uniref:hypothetical protein n=1 Tax=Methylomonas methanica TaxID=421 RepID=UPI000A577804|nr:hypothetical protein [Methylomonas methanica]